MRKALYSVLFMLIGFSFASAQENAAPTDRFSVEGKVKHPLVFTLDQASAYHTTNIDSIVIYNHLMQRKRAVHHIRGILLKDVIEKAEIDMASPKSLSEIYITCVASDNYKVVFSWNELFNTPVGKQVLIISSMDDQPAAQSKERITMLSAGDEATGRRFVKGVSKIVVEQVK